MDEITRRFQPALPMRGVTRRTWLYPFHSMISTRTPHAGSDRYGKFRYLYVKEFQPALPMRGVTPPICKTLQSRRFQPALPMRGVTAHP